MFRDRDRLRQKARVRGRELSKKLGQTQPELDLELCQN